MLTLSCFFCVIQLPRSVFSMFVNLADDDIFSTNRALLVLDLAVMTNAPAGKNGGVVQY